MAARKWTPAPWRFSEMRRPPIGTGPHETDSEGNVFWGYSISGSDKHGGAILPTLGCVHNFPEQCEANAHLIAAAPDMAEALAECITTMDHARVFVNSRERIKQPEGSDLYDEALAKARAALARARGDTP